MKNEVGMLKTLLLAVALSTSAFTCGGSDDDGNDVEPTPTPEPEVPAPRPELEVLPIPALPKPEVPTPVLPDPGPLGPVNIMVLAPLDRDEIPADSIFELRAEGVTIAPSTDRTPGTGYFVIALDGRCTAANEVIPRNARHVHIDGGQSMAAVRLPPGPRDLCVQVAFGDGRAYDGAAELTVYVY